MTSIFIHFYKYFYRGDRIVTHVLSLIFVYHILIDTTVIVVEILIMITFGYNIRGGDRTLDLERVKLAS